MARSSPRLGALLALASTACGGAPPTEIFFGAAPLRGVLPAGAWYDYYVNATDEDSNIVFTVNATSEYANALGIYVSDPPSTEELPDANTRSSLSPGDYLDYDTTSMIVVDGVRHYSVVVGQCYVRKGQLYYLSVFGKNAAGGPKPSVPFDVSVKRVPAAIPLTNGSITKITGSVCDNRYMHYFWEIDSRFQSGGVRTTISKQEGELEAAYMRYEHCAGLAGANMADVGLSGHGSPSGRVTLPMGPKPLEAGRYYVSLRGKQELCGNYEITVEQLNQHQLLSSPAATLRAGGGVTMLLSLLPAWLLARVAR